MSTKRKSGKGASQPLRLSKARLDELIEEALVDAYGEPEQVTGFYTMLENDLRLPFETEILGMTVTVEGIDITEENQLVAVCRNGKSKQWISLSALPLPSPLPEGAEWIVGYRYWQTGKRWMTTRDEETRAGSHRSVGHRHTQVFAGGDRSRLAKRVVDMSFDPDE